MKMRLFLILFILCVQRVHAQEKDTTSIAVKYGKVSPAEFNTKVSGVDSAASGFKLFDIGKGWFELSRETGGFVYMFERHIRFKVMKKAGYDLANFDIQLYHGDGGSEQMESMIGATYNLENNEIIASNLAKDAKFTEKYDKNWTVKKYTLSNVKEGSILEFKYRIKSDFFFNLREWCFQSSIPTLYSEFSIRVPKYFSYRMPITGSFQPTVVSRENMMESYYLSREEDNSTDRLTVMAFEIKYNAKNVPAIKEESYITTIEDYISKVSFELDATRLPGRTVQNYVSSWSALVNKLNEEELFGRFINRNSYSKTLLPTIIHSETDPLSKAQLIFNFVKCHIKWDSKFNKFSSQNNLKAVLDSKSGNSADINLSLLSLLKEARINVAPVLLSTRSNGVHPGYPMLGKFNNVIVLVEISGKCYLLDATDKHLNMGSISYENLSHKGLLIDMIHKDASWISLEDSIPSSRNIVYNLKLTDNYKMEGSIEVEYSGQLALQHRNTYSASVNESEYLKDFKKDRPGLEILNYTVENLDQSSAPFKELMNVRIEDNVEEAGKLLMISPLLFERTKDNPFKLAERNFPVDFAFPLQENLTIIIDYPKGYVLETLPGDSRVKLPDDLAVFSLFFTHENNRIKVNSQINIPQSVYTATGYHYLKELFRRIVEKQAQLIVFKKS